MHRGSGTMGGSPGRKVAGIGIDSHRDSRTPCLTISYYFVPPYYGNSVILLTIIDGMSRIVNQVLPRSHILSNIFGNVAIIQG